ncbi:MAG: T9SS type A sorting domain-containing protein [Bacteroidetes bacterium]|nr:T9SS type A sorting domain-containing protein [Bacteroidota bacterium]
MRLIIVAYLIMLALCSMANTALAQHIFQYSYGQESVDEVAFRITNENDSTFVIAGEMTNSYGRQHLLMKVNDKGEKLWSKYYHRKGDNSTSTLLKLQNGNFLVNSISCRDSNCTSWVSYFLEINTNGDLVKSFLFDDSVNFIFPKLQMSNGDLVFSGGQISSFPSYQNPIILKTDSLYNTIWCKVYTFPNTTSLYSAVELDNKQLLIAGYGHQNTLNTQQGTVVNIDSIGNILLAKQIDSINFTSIFKTSSNDFYLGACSILGGANSGAQLVVKYDSGLNMLWAKQIIGAGSTCLGEMHRDQLGAIWGVRNIGITKIDSNGNFVSDSKMYLNPGFFSIFGGSTDFTFTSDKGILMVSSIINNTNYPKANIILTKADSTMNRCETQNYTFPSYQVFPTMQTILPLTSTKQANLIPVTEFIQDTIYMPKVIDCDLNTGFQDFLTDDYSVSLYPNPFIDLVNLKLASINEINKYEISIINITTNKIEYNSQLNVNDVTLNLIQLNPGIYILQINGINRLNKHLKIIKQ